MALRGSLHEFELPDIFQLIANDGKTGQLVIYNKENEAFIIFFRGAIIAAGNSVMNLQTILYRYLMDVRNYSEQELNELLYLCQGEMRLFTQELVNKRYLMQQELSAIARMGIEDLACSLFLWEDGHYRFDSLDGVDDYRVEGVSLSSDVVIMEAMRRVDEWNRMSAVMGPDTVFVPVKSNAPAPQAAAGPFPIMDPAGYIFSLIDGVTSVDELCRGAFFTEYRIYETLMDFWQNNRIMPYKMPQTLSKTASQQKIKKPLPAIAAGTLSFVIVHCVAALIVAFGYLLHNNVFEKRALARQWSSREVSAFQSDNKVRIAILYYHGMYGHDPAGNQQLIETGFLSAWDK